MQIFSKIKKLIRVLYAAIQNYFSDADVLYVIEDAAWVIRKEGENLVSFLKNENVKMKLTITHFGARFKIVHFGSINTYLTKSGAKKIHASNKVIVTWYHSEEKDKRLDLANSISKQIDLIHTSCALTQKTLMAHGVPEEKIRVVHIPIDLSVFKFRPELRTVTRAKYGIGDDQFVIGSFQKDGDGWGEGLIPKLIKGPDIFCDVVEKIKEKIPVHVLLSGPARGYVKKRLEKMQVTYSHVYFDRPDDVCELYQALDLYLLTSRVEGGPKSLMESWASGVPLVASKVGMVIDHSVDNMNGLYAEVGDVQKLSDLVFKIFNDPILRKRLVEQGLKDVVKLSYEAAASKYKNIYQSFRQ